MPSEWRVHIYIVRTWYSWYNFCLSLIFFFIWPFACSMTAFERPSTKSTSLRCLIFTIGDVLVTRDWFPWSLMPRSTYSGSRFFNLFCWNYIHNLDSNQVNLKNLLTISLLVSSDKLFENRDVHANSYPKYQEWLFNFRTMLSTTESLIFRNQCRSSANRISVLAASVMNGTIYHAGRYTNMAKCRKYCIFFTSEALKGNCKPKFLIASVHCCPLLVFWRWLYLHLLIVLGTAPQLRHSLREVVFRQFYKIG